MRSWSATCCCWCNFVFWIFRQLDFWLKFDHLRPRRTRRSRRRPSLMTLCGTLAHTYMHTNTFLRLLQSRLTHNFSLLSFAAIFSMTSAALHATTVQPTYIILLHIYFVAVKYICDIYFCVELLEDIHIILRTNVPLYVCSSRRWGWPIFLDICR